MKNFLSHSDVLSALKKAENAKISQTHFSDVKDEHGNQYVDLVQEGGGVLGIALVGYTYVLEKAGIRFFNLAGTSAGAINTMMMACMGKVGEENSEKILEILSAKDLSELVDGSKAVRKVINKAVSGEGGLAWALAWNGIKIWKILKRELGINPGDDFVNWMTQELKKAKIHNLNDLEEHRKVLPQLFGNNGDEIHDLVAKLALVTSDITTNTKTVFPKMAPLYYANLDHVKPAEMVRSSMSVPFFFEPYTVNNIPNANKKQDSSWIKMASYYGEVPAKARFVDGGMLSNFPINIFHRTDGGVPRMPTFGVRLSTYREGYNKTDSVFGMAGAMISTMRQIHDYDFLVKNPDYNQLICLIDADKEFNWLNFNMTKEEQIELFALGAKKAGEFIEKFNWNKYKDTRAKMANI